MHALCVILQVLCRADDKHTSAAQLPEPPKVYNYQRNANLFCNYYSFILFEKLIEGGPKYYIRM